MVWREIPIQKVCIMVHGRGSRTPSRSAVDAIKRGCGSNLCLVVAVEALNYGVVKGRNAGTLQREVKRINGKLGELLGNIGGINYSTADNKFSFRVINRLFKDFKRSHRKDAESVVLRRLKERQLWGRDCGPKEVHKKYVAKSSVSHWLGKLRIWLQVLPRPLQV